MKKFRNEVWISDEDYDLIENIPNDRKMTTEELAAVHRAINAYYFSYYDDRYVGLKLLALYAAYTFVCAGIGFLVGRFVG